ncbi:MAG: ATP-binding cassette domain-containing protein [Planctomycetes bacterium]|nr:ATP-binding cassette domain-containing protein [Planctomycetota bacterium]
MSATDVIVARGLTKRFGTKPALAGLDLELHRGEILGFVGPNGAGKSTCLRILLGIVARDDGALRVLGLDPAVDGLAIRRRASYLPGETSVYPFMTGAGFLEFALGFHAARRALPAALGDAFALPLHAKVRTYSAGMKQKLALLATLLADVELYILDEPDRALDATARLRLRDALRELRDAGKTILLSTHHLSEVEALADRIEFVFDGRHVADASVQHARAVLRRELRVRLTREPDWPPGVESITRDHDGAWRVRVTGEPLAWLAALPAAEVLSAEFGAARLEDLYRVLQDGHVARGAEVGP